MLLHLLAKVALDSMCPCNSPGTSLMMCPDLSYVILIKYKLIFYQKIIHLLCNTLFIVVYY